MSSKYKKYMPYIRKATGKEKADDLRTCMRLSHFETHYEEYYVMVQHGFPNSVMEVGKTKEDIKNQILVVALGIKSFNQWKREIRNDNNKFK